MKFGGALVIVCNMSLLFEGTIIYCCKFWSISLVSVRKFTALHDCPWPHYIQFCNWLMGYYSQNIVNGCRIYLVWLVRYWNLTSIFYYSLTLCNTLSADVFVPYSCSFLAVRFNLLHGSEWRVMLIYDFPFAIIGIPLKVQSKQNLLDRQSS